MGRHFQIAALAAAGSALLACAPAAETARSDYDAFCASCHGESGEGDGWAAAALAKKPSDLTRIAERNGGDFDLIAVMSRIDGYTRDDAGQVMPDFGPLLDGEKVLIDTGGGILTPTPVRLLALAEYLGSIQAGG